MFPTLILQKRLSETGATHLLALPRCHNIRMRSYSTSLSIPDSSIYLSNSTDPLWNLSLEDLLFRKSNPAKPLLLFYRDAPCVIIGRNQNPWKEINHKALKEARIPFVRRRSGGGTVYHDLGNVNFSLHLPRISFERKKGSTLAVEALHRLGVKDAHINERNDVCVDSYKISSAYKIINSRAYHHGTMLVFSALTQLKDVLRSTKHSMKGRSVESVRSPVTNLVDVQPGITHEAFCSAMASVFAERYGVDGRIVIVGEKDLGEEDKEFIRKGMQELESWEWRYGQTLEFCHPMEGIVNGKLIRAEIEAKHGIITKCSITYPQGGEEDELARLSEILVGKKYGFLDFPELVKEGRKVVEWLQREMS